jgi:integrase
MALKKEIVYKTAKPKEKAYKIFDGEGLFLLVMSQGSKYWRLKYRFNGKEKLLALGVYDQTTLAEARIKRNEARNLLAKGIDPGLLKQEKKQSNRIMTENCFETIAREWHAKLLPQWTSKHGARIIRQLENDVFPWLGERAISTITPPELLKTLQRIENRGAIETAHRAQQTCGQIFRYAIATGRAERDPSADLRGALPPARKKHHASLIETRAIGNLLRAINDYQGHFVTKCALRLATLLLVRPGELRHAEWSELDLEAAEWRIPAEKMKMKLKHIVPLPTQAITILRELRPLTGDGNYVFPCVRASKRPMSENTVNAGLRRLGYTKEEMTGHGFRSMASTLLNEQGWNRDAIERQLAHAERNNIRAAYNYAEYLPERRKMMQHWADYLDVLANHNNVMELKIA